MRRDDNIWQVKQRRVPGRLNGKGVQAESAQLSFFQGSAGGILIHNAAAGGIYDDGILLGGKPCTRFQKLIILLCLDRRVKVLSQQCKK